MRSRVEYLARNQQRICRECEKFASVAGLCKGHYRKDLQRRKEVAAGASGSEHQRLLSVGIHLKSRHIPLGEKDEEATSTTVLMTQSQGSL